MAVVPYDDFVYTCRIDNDFESEAQDNEDYWGGALLFVGNGGADDLCVCEYNHCEDGHSGIYATHRNHLGEYETNINDFDKYHADLNDPHWKAKLFAAMVHFYTARIDEFE